MRSSILLVLAALATALGASAQFINWVQYVNPTQPQLEPGTTFVFVFDDNAYSVCLFGRYVAVVGESPQFVALLDKESGQIVKMWRGEPNHLRDCVTIGDWLYVVGNELGTEVMYIFDKDLNVVKKILSDYGSTAPYSSVVYDGEYLYLGGATHVESVEFSVWEVEKRS